VWGLGEKNPRLPDWTLISAAMFLRRQIHDFSMDVRAAAAPQLLFGVKFAFSPYYSVSIFLRFFIAKSLQYWMFPAFYKGIMFFQLFLAATPASSSTFWQPEPLYTLLITFLILAAAQFQKLLKIQKLLLLQRI
jgi:hypothetical protein